MSNQHIPTFKGLRHSEETKRKMSKNNKGKNNAMFGRHHSRETLAKISAASKLLWQDPQHRLRMSLAQTGRKHLKETRERMSKSQKGRTFTEETRRKMSKNHVDVSGSKNPMFGKEKDSIVHRHHIYLKQNSDKTMKFTRREHLALHNGAYGYIYTKYGKKGIDDYLKWFDREFGLK